MKRYILMLFLGFICVCLLVSLTQDSSTDTYYNSSQGAITVVLYGDQKERWVSLIQGVRQACRELNLEETVLTVSLKSTSDEQMELLDREVDNGTKGVLITVTNSDEMKDPLVTLSSTTPIVTMETGVGESLPFVSGNNYEMGLIIAENLSLPSDDPVMVVKEQFQRNSIDQRHLGFVDSMKKQGIHLIKVENRSTMSLADYLLTQINIHSPRVIVAWDPASVESAIDAVLRSNKDIAIYGVGSSEKIVHFIDKKVVNSICYQDEFSMGYVGVYQLAEKMGMNVTVPSSEVFYYFINKENLYDPTIQHFIFPIV